MVNALPHSHEATHQGAEIQEAVDDNWYRNLSIAFLVGMVFLFGLFTFMLIILAGSQPS
jgi:maltodextrin utilization protein YvdJ